MMKVLIKLITCAVLLAGCAPHPLTQPPKRTEAVILFNLVDELPSYAAPNSVAVTRCLSDGLCEMHILESYYPECLVHEFGHVTHKDWHGNIPTTCRYGSNFK